MVALWERFPKTIVLEGGNSEPESVTRVAEHAWLSLGGKCWSYRPKQIDSRTYCVEIWKLGGARPRIEAVLEPTFKDFTSVLRYRSVLMLENAKRCVSFYNGWSPGTAEEIALAADFVRNPHQKLEALYHH